MKPTPTYRPRRAWTIASLLAVMMTTNFLDKAVIGLVAVPMMAELKLSPTEFGLLGASFYWLYALGAVGGGLAANRRPARYVLLAMALGWALVQLPMALSGSFLAFLACRALLGFAEGPASPVAIHALYKWFPDHRRSLPVALLYQGSSVGLLLAGLLIPLVTAHWGWRMNFVLLAAVGVVWCVAWWFLGGEGDLEPAAEARAGDTTPRIRYGRLLADRTVLGVYAAHFAAHWALAASLTWLNGYLQQGLGYPPVTAGRMFALFVLITSPITLAMAWGSQRLMLAGMPSRLARGGFMGLSLVLGGLGTCAMLGLELSALERFLLLAVSGGMTLCVNAIGPAILAEVVPHGQRSAMLAIGNAVASAGGMAAPVVTGWLVQRSPGAAGYEQGFFVNGLVLVAAGVLAMLSMNPGRSLRRLAYR